MSSSTRKSLLALAILHLFTLISAGNSVFSPSAIVDMPEDAKLNSSELSIKYGVPCEEHDVTTKDGYILKLFHMKGDSRKPVFVMHGLLGSSDDFLIRGNTSVAVQMAKAGYDVWLGNYRGNRYSRRHVTLVPDNDKKFWDFGPHELATLDLRTMIDYVLAYTKQPTLSVLGFSEGTYVTFILTSYMPEYNDKIRAFIALAPVAFMSHVASPYPEILKFLHIIDAFLQASSQEEISGFYSSSRYVTTFLCSIQVLNFPLCMNGILFPIAGFNPLEYEEEFVPVIFGHIFAGTSRKNIIQLFNTSVRKVFARYDYGPARNLVEYGTVVPPSYDLSNVRVDVHLVVGRNDRLSTLKDMERLKAQLTSCKVFEYTMTSPSFTHADFLYGKRGHRIISDKILKILAKYNNVDSKQTNNSTEEYIKSTQYNH